MFPTVPCPIPGTLISYMDTWRLGEIEHVPSGCQGIMMILEVWRTAIPLRHLLRKLRGDEVVGMLISL